jgi:ferritin-like metal-binding protein YciE
MILGTVQNFIKYAKIATALESAVEKVGGTAELAGILDRIETAKTDCTALVADFQVIAEAVQNPKDILANATKLAALQTSAAKIEEEARACYADLEAIASRAGADFDSILADVKPLLEEAK